MRHPNLSFSVVSAGSPKVQVSQTHQCFWESTEGSHSQPCKCEPCIPLTNYPKGEQGQLLPQPVHALLQRCLGSLEKLEVTGFSLGVVWDEEMMVSSEQVTQQSWFQSMVPCAFPTLNSPKAEPVLSFSVTWCPSLTRALCGRSRTEPSALAPGTAPAHKLSPRTSRISPARAVLPPQPASS